MSGETTTSLRNVYTTEQFASDVYCGNRTAEWVRKECRRKRIRTVARHPYLIPQSEALRVISPEAPR